MPNSDEGYLYYGVPVHEPEEEFKLPEGFVEWDIDTNVPMYTRDYLRVRQELLMEHNGRVYQAVERNEPIPSRENLFDSAMDEIRNRHAQWCRSGPIAEVAELYGISEEAVEAARRVCYPEDFGRTNIIHRAQWADEIVKRIKERKREV